MEGSNPAFVIIGLLLALIFSEVMEPLLRRIIEAMFGVKLVRRGILGKNYRVVGADGIKGWLISLLNIVATLMLALLLVALVFVVAMLVK